MSSSGSTGTKWGGFSCYPLDWITPQEQKKRLGEPIAVRVATAAGLLQDLGHLIAEYACPAITVWQEVNEIFGSLPEKLPPVRSDIHGILEMPCPFFSGRSVGETHSLILVSDKAWNLGRFLSLSGVTSWSDQENHYFLMPYGKKEPASYFFRLVIPKNEWSFLSVIPFQPIHWALILGPVPESERKSFSSQEKLLNAFCRNTGAFYQIANLSQTLMALATQHVFNRILIHYNYVRVKEASQLWKKR